MSVVQVPLADAVVVLTEAVWETVYKATPFLEVLRDKPEVVPQCGSICQAVEGSIKSLLGLQYDTLVVHPGVWRWLLISRGQWLELLLALV